MLQLIIGQVEGVARAFNAGGQFMWIILAVLAFAVAVAIERLIFYTFVCKTRGVKMAADVARALNSGKMDDAKKIVCCRRAPVDILLRTAVELYGAGMKADEIREGVEEAAVRELPRMSQRLNYLSLFANIATLLGLLGTISGLQVAFSSLTAVEAARKATMLAQGISEAMNTTFFGLVVAVPCMILYTVLTNIRDRRVKDLDEAVVKILNYLKKKTQ
jgi:biopolymer transport protein ExbB/TolQ